MARMIGGRAALIAAGLIAASSAMSVPAHAADDAMKRCGTQYQAAKAGNTLGGKTWAQFLAQCRGSQAAAVAPPAASAAKPASHLPGAQSPAMVAMHDRQRQCAQQWKADKAAGKVPAGQTWPQYWSACNTRMKKA